MKSLIVGNAGIEMVILADPGTGMPLGNAANPLSVTVGSPAAGAYPLQTGQVKIVVTGTAVQLTTTSQVLENGVIIKAAKGNNVLGGTIGLSAVNNKVDGTGNGMIIDNGASTSIGGGVNINTLYVNGTAGDIFSFQGN